MKNKSITKKVRQVTGSVKGVTFTKDDIEFLNVDKDDYVEVKKVE